MNYRFTRFSNKSFGVMKIFGNENKYHYYTELVLIPKNNWEKDYLNVKEFKQEEVFERLCLIDNLLYSTIYSKYDTIPVINKNELNTLEKELHDIVNYDMFNYGYSIFKMDKENKVKIKMLTILLRNNMIKLFREKNKRYFIAIPTETLYKTLDKGFDGFRLVFIERLDNETMNNIFKCFKNSNDYIQCFVETKISTKLVTK